MQIYTDGGCSGNPGPGGWAYVMVIKTFQGETVAAEDWGAEHNTTNNRMELMAVISALKALKEKKGLPRQITLYTDSQYVQKGITEWIQNWKARDWKTADKKPVKNKDLWQELDSISFAGDYSINWQWIKGHAGNVYNERCDSLTQKAIASIR